MRPPAELAQHVAGLAAPRIDAGAFRQGWHVLTRLDVLQAEGAISVEAYAVALRFRADLEAAIVRETSVLMAFAGAPGGVGGGGGHDRQYRAARARSRLRPLLQALGGLHALLIEQCVLLDLSWPEIGRRHMVAHHTARRWTIRALGHLERASQRLDGAPPIRPESGRLCSLRL